MRIHTDLTRVLLAFAAGLFVASGWEATGVAESESDRGAFPWIVEPAAAAAIIEEGEPVVLDTRDESAYESEHVAGAVQVDWEAFTPSQEEDRGELLADEATLQEKLRGLGVDGDRPVLVVGNPPDNWGEDGRIVWMLRSLGHDSAGLVDGGYAALAGEGVETTDQETDPESGDFEVDRRGDWLVERAELRELVDGESDQTVIVDTRSEREYRGETPYGEDRAGHLPGAVHLHYRALLDEEGRLRPASEVRSLLDDRGIAADKRVVAYCTGGVRSAWLTVVLAHLGYERVANYAGSGWDWAAAPEEDHPLVTE
jgi:thiosulfate/3-mercaptopyruvate sulfurtransferase